MIEKDFIIEAKRLVEQASNDKNFDLFCTTRDIFDARYLAYGARTKRYSESVAISEIGTNSFDHNFIFDEKHVRGAYFNPYYSDNCVILADYGKGIFNSLKNVVDINDCVEALKVAFTEKISGRAPEQRGYGLKLVFNTVKSNGWDLYYQSGNGCCIIENGIAKFQETSDFILGTFAILKF